MVFTSLLADESPFILEDDEYIFKYRAQLRSVILRAKASPRALLKGYSVYLAPHVQPPVETLSTIVKFAGGKVCWKLAKFHTYKYIILITFDFSFKFVIG